MQKNNTDAIKHFYDGLFDGPHATPKESISGPIFLGIKNITEDGHLDLSEIKHISEEEFPKWTKRVVPKEGDVVFVYEATLNRYALIPKNFRGCLGRRLALIRPNKEKLDSKFLYYYFFGDNWRKIIQENTITGSTVDRIPIAKFPEFKVSLPELTIQKKISSILSAYDDLIENNNKRIKILEQTGKSIYKDWFIDNANSSWGKSSLMECNLFNFENKNIGKFEDKKVYYETADINNISIVKDGLQTDYVTKPSRAQKQPKINSVWFARMSNTKKILVFTEKNKKLVEKSILSSGFAGFSTKEEFLGYLYFSINSDFFNKQKDLYATGATQISINNDGIKRIIFRIPSVEKIIEYSKISNPLINQIIILDNENKKLEKIKQLSLPKLISGELDVEDLDIKIRPEIL